MLSEDANAKILQMREDVLKRCMDRINSKQGSKPFDNSKCKERAPAYESTACSHMDKFPGAYEQESHIPECVILSCKNSDCPRASVLSMIRKYSVKI